MTSESVLVKNQKKQFSKTLSDGRIITVFLRYDDECGNGHNSFSITGQIENPKIRGRDKIEMCGCIHEEIKKHFPEFKHLIKWHLMSSDEPMHYVANTLYYAKRGDLEAARSCAIWPEAKLEDITRLNLEVRLPQLVQDFRSEMENLGFTF